MAYMEDFYRELEELGLDEVETKLRLGVYNSKRKTLAEAWANDKKAEAEAERQLREEGRADELVRIAKEANDISRESLDSAKVAATKTTTAVWIAGVSALAAVVSAVIAWVK